MALDKLSHLQKHQTHLLERQGNVRHRVPGGTNSLYRITTSPVLQARAQSTEDREFPLAEVTGL